MTNVPGELTGIEERQLLECYATLHRLAATCVAPGVLAAVRLALAELHAALDGEALEFEYYSHLWDGEPAGAGRALAS
jgi:hypothetical protein